MIKRIFSSWCSYFKPTFKNVFNRSLWLLLLFKREKKNEKCIVDWTIFHYLDSVGKSTKIFVNAEQQSDWYSKRIVCILLGFVWILVLTASITISTILSTKGVPPEGWMVPYKAMYSIYTIQHIFNRSHRVLTIYIISFAHLFQISNRTNYIRAILYNTGIANAWRFRNFILYLSDSIVFCMCVHLFDCFCTQLCGTLERCQWNGFEWRCHKQYWLQNQIHTNRSISYWNLWVKITTFV